MKVKKKKDNIKKSRKHKKLKPIGIVIILICVCGLGLGLFNILKWNADNKSIDKQIEELDKYINVEEIPGDHDDAEPVNPPKEGTTVESDYYKYLKLPLISVDFSELLAKNQDTVGFIKVNGTNINYPIVQASDNDYYLTHAFDKSNNGAGWIFLDYRNDINNLQDNTIVYGHGRTNITMFGSLKNIFKSSWYEDTENYVVNLSTPEYNTLWQVVSIYSVPTETYYLTSSFGTTESKQKFLDTIVGRSIYNFNTSVNTNDKILTLSTCLNDNEKVVLHAKLIKQQVR
ncbi:MAG: class B sortase [Ruminococcus sp.]|nr:class B sortase [Ruminococcus sp.]